MRGRGTVSLILLSLSWLALDDITTDSAHAFPLEYAILVTAGMWFAVLGASLIVQARLLMGICSLLAVALGVVACWSLPHHYQPPSPINYLGFVPLAWFLGLAVWLLLAGPIRPDAVKRALGTGGISPHRR
jgi:peptidoglycan/LPS O-acetylase OafA/YrhL